MAALGVCSIRNALTPSGNTDTRYVDGNDGTAAIPLTWDTISDLSDKLEGTPFSVNVRTEYLTEAGSPDATITVLGSLPSGWSFASPTLSYSGTGTGTGTIQLQAVRGSDTAISNFFVVGAQAPAVSDTTAPPVVTGLVATPLSGQVKLDWDPVSDPHDGTQSGTRVRYLIKKDGVTVHTTAFHNSHPSVLAQQIIGASDGTPDSDQTGTNWTGSFGGTGIDDASDHLLGRLDTHTGDGIMVVKLPSLPSATSSFPKLGLMIRESLDPGAKMACVYLQKNTKVQFKSRANDALTPTQHANLTFDAPRWLKLERSGDLINAYHSSDGGAWTQIVAGQTVQMLSTVYWGWFITATSVSSETATGSFQNFNISDQGTQTYTHTTSTSGTYTIVAEDEDGNQSAASTGVEGAPTVVSGTLIRYYPGHYGRNGLGDTQSSIINAINATANIPEVKGWCIYTKWVLVETSKGVFSQSFLGPIVTAAKAANKKLGLRIQDRQGGTTVNLSSILPSYLMNEGLTFQSPSRAGASLFLEDCMTYNINVYKKLVDWYGEEVMADGTPLLGLLLGEESVFGPSVSGYTAAACTAQEIRRAQELRTYAPKIPWAWLTNWINGDNSAKDRMKSYFDMARTDKGVPLNGGPDVRPAMPDGNSTDGYRFLVGTHPTGSGIDYRDDYLVLASSELFETNEGFDPIDTYNTAVGTNESNYLIWYAQNFSGTSAQRWTTGIIPIIQSNPTNTSIPTQLVGLVTTV